jgi:hypothetical protein
MWAVTKNAWGVALAVTLLLIFAIISTRRERECTRSADCVNPGAQCVEGACRATQ